MPNYNMISIIIRYKEIIEKQNYTNQNLDLSCKIWNKNCCKQVGINRLCVSNETGIEHEENEGNCRESVSHRGLRARLRRSPTRP